MDQDENKAPDTADAEPQQDSEAEIARKREEALRKVDAMLQKERAETAQRQLDTLNRFSKRRVHYIVKTEEQAYNPTLDLVPYKKPDKPLEEMTPEEREAEQKRQAAFEKMNAMLLHQHAEKMYAEESGRSRLVILPKARKPIEENKVDIAGFLSQYKLSPEAQEKFEKMRFGSSKGIVRPGLGIRLISIFLPVMLLFSAWVIGMFPTLAGTKPVFIILGLLIAAKAYYIFTWKLEYDSESNLVKYHSLFHGTNLYGMQDLMGFMVCPRAEKPFPLSLLGLLDPRQYLVIRLPDHVINIPLLFSTVILAQQIELEGFEGASDFYRCLDQYQHALYRKQAESAKKPEPVPNPAAGIPAVPEPPKTDLKKPAAPAQPKTDLKKPAAPEKPVKPEKPAEQPKPAPKPDPVDLAKAREMFAQPAPSVLSMPERSADFPDPTRSSAFPDPAQGGFPDPTKKPDVDVDALFNQVLRDHGKLK